MKPFEFVLIIISVIVGLALTEFAIGVAYMIQNYDTAHYYWPYIVLMAVGFMSCMTYWATVYKLRKIPTWTIAHIGLVFSSGLLLFVMAKIYFPDPNKFDLDYEKYFNNNVRTLFSLMICFVISYSLEAIVIRKVRQIRKFVMMFLFVLVTLSGIIISNSLYISVLTIVLFLMQLFYMSRTNFSIADKEG